MFVGSKVEIYSVKTWSYEKANLMILYFFGQSIINCMVLHVVMLMTFVGEYLGLNVKQTNGCMSIYQNLHIDKLSEVEINSERKLEKHAQLNKKAQQLHGLAGQLNLVSSPPDKRHLTWLIVPMK